MLGRHSTCAGSIGALLVFAVSTAFSAPSPAPAAPPPEVPIPQSVFVDRPDFGRDPFFPKSERRGKAAPVNHSVEPQANFGDLALKGISGTVEKRLAIINNKTFEIGEEAVVRVQGQLVKVKCAEIREKSVVVILNGVSKELFLGPKL